MAVEAEVVITRRTPVHLVSVGKLLAALIAGIAPLPRRLRERHQVMVGRAAHSLRSDKRKVVVAIPTGSVRKALSGIVVPLHLHPPVRRSRALDRTTTCAVLKATGPVWSPDDSGPGRRFCCGDLAAGRGGLSPIQRFHKVLIRGRHQQIVRSLLPDPVAVRLPGAIPLHRHPALVIPVENHTLTTPVLVVPLPVRAPADTHPFAD
mmetsp:Transcript_98146/g.262096  ORF Transcript_98146/g.262096 Transcript_98146/m.262096 type:complete len:206 (+) Transcript_98146:1158-1775(+)